MKQRYIEIEKNNTYVFNCRTKLEKLLCLKYFGSRSRANSGGFQTTKLLLVELQDTIASVAGSSTMSYVLLRKGGGAFAMFCTGGGGCGAGAPPPLVEVVSPPSPAFLLLAPPPSILTTSQIFCRDLLLKNFLQSNGNRELRVCPTRDIGDKAIISFYQKVDLFEILIDEEIGGVAFEREREKRKEIETGVAGECRWWLYGHGRCSGGFKGGRKGNPGMTGR